MNTKLWWVALLGVALMITAPAVAQRGGLVYHECQVVDEFGRKVTDITSVTIYAPGTTTASTIYMDSALASAITQPMTTSSTNTTLASGKFYWWGPEGWDYTVTDGTNTHTNNGHNAMSASMSRIVFPSYLQSISSTTYSDAQSATFGSDSDFVLVGGATADRFTVTPNATDETAAWWFGANLSGVDVFMYAATSGDYVQWDASDESLEFVGTSITLDDDSPLYLGSSTDVTVKYDGSGNDLDITSTTALDEITLGATGDGYDVKWWSTTAGDYVLFDYSADAILLEDTELFLGDGEGLYFGDALGTGDFKISDASDVLLIDVVVAGTGEIAIGNDADDVPFTWYGETTGNYVKMTGDQLQIEGAATGAQLALGDGDAILLGDTLGTGDFSISDSSDVLLITQVADGTGSVAFSADGEGMDVKFYGDTASSFMLWDENGNTNGALVLDAADILIGDGDILNFGDGTDVTIAYDGSNNDLDITSTTDLDEIAFGATGDGYDIIWWNHTAGDYVLFDYSGDAILLEDTEIFLGDGEGLYFGDAVGTGDIKFYASGTDMIIDGVIAETGTVAIGVTDKGLDFKLWAATDADGILWDASDEALEITGAGIVLDDGSIVVNDDDDLAFGDSSEVHIEYDEDGYDIAVIVGGMLIPDSADVEVHTENDTMDTAADVGGWHLCATDAVVFTLPAVATGLTYRFMNTAADGQADITVNPDNSDLFLGGCGFTALDDGDAVINTQTSADKGDYIVVTYGTADGWYIVDMCGTWADAS